MKSNGIARLTIPLLILAIGICVAPFVSAQAVEPEESRLRARALGIVVGSYTPGPLNAISAVELIPTHSDPKDRVATKGNQ